MKAETEPIVVPIKVDFPDHKKLIAVANQALKVASAWHALAMELDTLAVRIQETHES